MIATMTCEKPPWEVPQPMNVYPVTTEDVSGASGDIPKAVLSDETSPKGILIDITKTEEGPQATLLCVDDPTGVIVVVEG